jgi:hypothetical protein
MRFRTVINQPNAVYNLWHSLRRALALNWVERYLLVQTNVAGRQLAQPGEECEQNNEPA